MDIVVIFQLKTIKLDLKHNFLSKFLHVYDNPSCHDCDWLSYFLSLFLLLSFNSHAHAHHRLKNFKRDKFLDSTISYTNKFLDKSLSESLSCQKCLQLM